MLHPVGGGDVLFVTGGTGDSARYRCWHVAEELEMHGFKCAVAPVGRPLLPGYADRFKIFVFHRTLFVPSVRKLVDRIKKQGKEIIFDTDDLVYDPEYVAGADFYRKLNKLEREQYRHGVGGDILTDPYVKVCTTTTAFLADKLKEKGKQVYIVPNKLSKEDLRVADEILARKPKRDEDKVRLGYFSGTASHDRDFATIMRPIRNILSSQPQAELHIFGPLELGPGLETFQGRVIRHRFAARVEHFMNLSGIDINLIPLELGNPFCESKSELKFFEAGILGIPSVAVANRTFSEAIENGRDGILAADEVGWQRAIEKLIGDPDLRRIIGKNAQKKARSKYTTAEAYNPEYYSYLRNKLKD